MLQFPLFNFNLIHEQPCRVPKARVSARQLMAGDAHTNVLRGHRLKSELVRFYAVDMIPISETIVFFRDLMEFLAIIGNKNLTIFRIVNPVVDID